MEAQSLRWFVATETRRSATLIILWSNAMSFVLAQAVYQRTFLSAVDIVVLGAICFLAGMISLDLGRALLSYLGAMSIALVLLFILAMLPFATGSYAPEASTVMFQLWLSIIFTSVFPFNFIMLLVVSVLGSGFGEKYL